MKQIISKVTRVLNPSGCSHPACAMQASASVRRPFAVSPHRRFILLAVVFFTSLTAFAIWQPLGSGLPGRVRALVQHNNELYAGGDFSGLISKWDGTNWVAVGAGLNGTSVRALISFNGELYAGGEFIIAGTSGNIAKWDGSNWVGVGDGLGGIAGTRVLCLYEWNGELYAGGSFTQSGTASVSKVAKLVSGSWTQVGGGAPPNCTAGVHAITSFNSQIYVGGEGQAPFINILDLTGTMWNSMPQGGINVGNGVYTLSAFNYPSQQFKSLFIGGDFSVPFTTCCTYQSGFWGTSLSVFTAGANDQINAFLSTTTNLYAGGVFTVQGVQNLAKKPTVGPWSGLGVTIDGGIDAFTAYQDFLVCGGDFLTADSTIVNHVMINYGVLISANDLTEKSSPNFFPNPAHSSLHFSHEGNSDNTHLTIYDVAGKQVFETEIQKECDIDLSGLKSGIFFYQISERGIKISNGKIILE